MKILYILKTKQQNKAIFMNILLNFAIFMEINLKVIT